MYIDKLNDIVSEYSNTYHRRIKIKPVDVKFNTYIDSMELHSNKEINDKYHKFKIGDHEKISKYNFAKRFTSNMSEEFLVIKKVKNTIPWTYVNRLQLYKSESRFSKTV